MNNISTKNMTTSNNMEPFGTTSNNFERETLKQHQTAKPSNSAANANHFSGSASNLQIFKFSNLLTLFALLIMSTVAWGQTVEIGSNSGNQYYAPTYPYYNYSYTQQIYTTSELSGISSGYEITSIAFYYSGSYACARKLNVSLHEVDDNDNVFANTSDWKDEGTSVVTNFDFTLPNSEGWQTISFTTPYIYQGGNLVVTVDDNTGSWVSGSSGTRIFRYTNTSSNYRCMYINNDTEGNVSPSKSGTRTSYRPDIKIAYTPCTAPAGDFSLSRTEGTIAFGNTLNLSSLISNSLPTGGSISYTSDNTSIASVSTSGVITAGSTEGTAHISVKWTHSNYCTQTATFTANVSACGYTIKTCGDANNTSYEYAPVNNYFKYTYSQIIYTPSELAAGTIHSIAFKYAYSSPMTKKNSVKIYMAETDKSTFSSSTDWITSGLTEVYSGNLNCSQGWNWFSLDNPFDYSGTKNLLVVIDDNTGTYDGSSYTFYYTSTSDRKYISFRSDTYNYGNDDISGKTASNYSSYYRPDTKFCIEGCTDPNFSLSSTSGSITLGGTVNLANLLRNNHGATPTYSSSNPSVASVSNAGVVTGVSDGTATITVTLPATTNGGTKYCAAIATYSVTVTCTEPTLSLSSTSGSAYIGDNVTLTLTNPNGTNVTWTSSNESIATVSGSNTGATIHAAGTGSATITASIPTSGAYCAKEVTYTISVTPGIASIPYFCYFEDASDNASWTLVNGNQTNKWYIGTAVNNGGSKSLYISNNNGTSNAYTNNSTTNVYAYRLLNFATAGAYDINFDWRANGESSYDYLRVYLMPATVAPVILAGEAIPTTWESASVYSSGNINQNSDWQTVNASATVNTTGTYYLIICWRNDDSAGTNPPAAVDNIEICFGRTLTFNCPSTVEIGSTTTCSASVSAGGGSITYSSLNPSIATVNSTTGLITGISAGSATIVATAEASGNYCPKTETATISVTPQIATIPYTCDFENTTENNNWVLTKATDGWYIGSAAASSPSKSLYVSNDNGVSNSYSATSQYIYAYRHINFANAGNYNVSYQWRCNGESSYDYMRVFLVPATASPNLTGGTNNSISTSGAPTNWITADGNTKLNLQGSSWQSVNENVSIPSSGLYYLVYYWHTDGSGTYNPPAAVDDIVIKPIWNITLVDGDGGSTSGSTTAVDGSSVTVTATAGYCHNFANWTENGTIVSTSASYTFTATANRTLTANFTAIENINPGISGSSVICKGDQVTLTASGNGTYAWSNGQSGTTISVTPEITTTYILTVTGNVCTGTAEHTVEVDEVQFTMSTNPADIACLAPGSQVTMTAEVGKIGSGTGTTYELPVNNYYKYTLSQQIFTAEEIGGRGTINSIAFEYAYETPMSSKTYCVIYMCETSKSEFTSTSDWIANSNFTQVYSGALNCSKGWNTFNLTTPFNYSGNGNLCIMVDDNSNKYNGSSYIFYCHTTTGNKTIEYYSDNTNTSPSSPTTASSITSTRNNIKLGFANLFAFQWYAGTTPISGETNATYTATPTALSTTYKVVVTNTDSNCTDYKEATATLTPSLSVGADHETICPNDQVVITANSNVSNYLWSTTATTASITVTPATTSTYTVSASGNGCTATAEQVITVDVPQFTLSTEPASLACIDPETEVTMNAAASNFAYNFEHTNGTFASVGDNSPDGTTTTDGDGTIITFSLPFDFVMQGTTFNSGTSIYMRCDGFVTFGSSWSNNTPSSPGTTYSVISALGYDQQLVGNSSYMYYKVEGSIGNRVLIMEWNYMRSYFATNSNYTYASYQIKIYEGSNIIEICYGDFSHGYNTSVYTYFSAGGKITNITSSYASPVITTNTSGSTSSISVSSSATAPANGTIYRFTPPQLTYQWYAGATSISGETNASYTVTPTALSTTYSVIATNAAGCTAEKPATVTLTPTITAVSADPADALCGGYPTTLTATSNATEYHWNNGAGNEATVTAQPEASTTYTVTASANGCTATGDVSVEVVPSPVLTITPALSEQCMDGETEIVLSVDINNDNSTGFEDDFEDGFDNWIPEGNNADYQWKRQAGTGSNSYPDAYNSSSYDAGIFINSRINDYAYLKLDKDLSSYTDIKLSFYYINPAWQSDIDYLYVQYSSNGLDYTNAESYTSSHTSWTAVNEITIPDGTKYIRFAAYGDYGYGVAIDNVTLSYTSNVTVSTYAWSNTGTTGTASGEYNETYTVTPASATNTYTITDETTGCTRTATVDVLNSSFITVAGENNGTVTATCGEDLLLSAGGFSNAVTYTWYNNSDLAAEHEVSPTITSDMNTLNETYYVKAEVEYPGEGYTVVGTPQTFSYSGDVQEYTIPEGVDMIKMEVWGAQGGNAYTTAGGRGGYSTGYYLATQGETLYVIVGGQGTSDDGSYTSSADLPGGYNGGGTGRAWNETYHNGAGGGGATHIANAAPSSGSDYQLRYYLSNKNNVLIVAGGGGGSSDNGVGGVGGGTTGSASASSEAAGNQTSGSAWGYALGVNHSGGESGGAGGGWYGGYSGSGEDHAGGGGSGYINEELSDANTIAGNLPMPTHDGTSTMTGNEGDGYAKITLYKRNTSVCSVSKAITVNINKPTINITPLSNNAICDGESFTFNPNAQGNTLTYEWQQGTTPIGDENSASYEASEAGTYNVTVTSSLGNCSTNATSSATLTVKPLPTATLETDHSPLCLGATATLTADGGTSYKWSNETEYTSDNTMEVSPTRTTTYSVTVKNDGCEASATLTQNVQQAPGDVPMTRIVRGHIWTGRVSSAWNEPNNWIKYQRSGYSVATAAPTANDTVIVRSGSTCIDNEPVITSTSTFKDLYIRDGRTLGIGNNANVTVSGDLSMDGGAAISFSEVDDTAILVLNNVTIPSGATIDFNENEHATLILNGGLRIENGANFVTDSGTVVFSGTFLSDTLFVDNLNPNDMQFNNVIFNMRHQRSGEVPHTSLPSGTKMNGMVFFEYGIVDCDLLEFTKSGKTQMLGGPTAYVNGKVKKTGGNKLFTFPTGANNVLGTVSAVIPTDVVVSAKFNSNSPSGFSEDDMPRWWNVADMCSGDGDNKFNHISNFEYWSVESPLELENVTLYAEGTEADHFNQNSPEFDQDAIAAGIYVNNCWRNLGGNTTVDDEDHAWLMVESVTMPRTITRANNPITFGSTDPNTILPIELTAFTAECDNSSAIVSWTTASEHNNEYFVLERSHDAENFVEVARIAGAGNSLEPINYSYTDYNMFNGDNYYRLWQVDFDGTRNASEIISVNCKDDSYEAFGEPTVEAYPNPFHSEITLRLENFGNQPTTIEIFDMLGKLIAFEKVDSPMNDYEMTLQLQNLAPATYNIRVTTDETVIVKKVVKK